MKSLTAGKNALILLCGDALIFFISLGLALTLRQLALPQATFFVEHVYPFTILFIIWVLIYFIAGLYDEEFLTIKGSIGNVLIVCQTIGAITAVALFYLMPFFNLSPKMNLAIFLVVFSVFIWFWRKFFINKTPISRKVLLIGPNEKLLQVFSRKNFYGFDAKDCIEWEQLHQVKSHDTSTLLVVNYQDPKFQEHAKTIQDFVFSGYEILNSLEIQERVFGAVDLSFVSPSWFVSEVAQPSRFFLFAKRTIDVVSGMVMLVLLAVLLPFICLWMLLEEKKVDLFFVHTRAGERNIPFVMYKLRTMSVKDGESWDGENHKLITRLGKLLRAFRIDELPQGINLIKGDISLVGPRAIFQSEQSHMEQRFPLYNLRLFAKPGITGWAQIKQKHAPMNASEAQDRLRYDLYYLEHRSIVFDLIILLKTIKTVALKLGVR